MANTRSAKKRIVQSLKRRLRNRNQRSQMRTAVKALRAAVEAGEVQKAQELLPKTLGIVDRTASKGVIHANAASRTKSRLTRAVSAAAEAAAAA